MRCPDRPRHIHCVRVSEAPPCVGSSSDLRPCTDEHRRRRVLRMRGHGVSSAVSPRFLCSSAPRCRWPRPRRPRRRPRPRRPRRAPPFIPLFLDDLTINKEVVGTPDAGSTFTVSFWCVPGLGPGGAVLPDAVTFDAQGHPMSNNVPVWLKGGAADCLLSETVARDPRTGTILRGDDRRSDFCQLHVRDRAQGAIAQMVNRLRAAISHPTCSQCTSPEPGTSSSSPW